MAQICALFLSIYRSGSGPFRNILFIKPGNETPDANNFQRRYNILALYNSAGNMFSKVLTVLSVTFVSANAHFFINTPVPISGSAIKDPLEASGSNFPCHGVDLSTPGARTAMIVGETQPLGFELANGSNTAVHGGGSCQISITYETDPTNVKDPANWKVIKSYIGGCPTDSKGNLPLAVACNGQNSPDCVNNLSFSIPLEVRNGNAILAWTWFNNVGNREMYMNCAAVSFTGGQNQINTLPNMFVANLASINSCMTTEFNNTDFPNPGKYVQTETPLNYPLNAPIGCGVSSESNVLQTSTTSALSPSYSGVPASPTGTTLRTVFTNAVGTPTNTNTQLGASSTPVKCPTGAVPCLSEPFFCINDTTFGQCNFGCAIPMKMAQGTNCIGNRTTFSKSRVMKVLYKRRDI
jgi:hypothetical protein